MVTSLLVFYNLLVILFMRARMSASMDTTFSPAWVYWFLAMAAVFVIVLDILCCILGMVVPRLGPSGIGSLDC